MTDLERKRRDRRAAFTLLEIMLVIVIIGVIAAVAIGNLDPGATADHAKRTTTETQIGGLSVAVERYGLALVHTVALKLDHADHQQLTLGDRLATLCADVAAVSRPVCFTGCGIRTHLTCTRHQASSIS